jgi:hypothetical protein
MATILGDFCQFLGVFLENLMLLTCGHFFARKTNIFKNIIFGG